MEVCVKLPLDEEQVKDLESQAKDYLFSNGLVMHPAQRPDHADVVTHVPATLLPSPVPQVLYEEAKNIQTNINLLIQKIALNHDFLWKCLESVVKVDDFTRNLWQIYNTVMQEGISQPYSLGMNRTDYMFDCGIPTLQVIEKQVKVDPDSTKLRMIEMNTMASSFGGLSQKMKYFHRFILERLGLYEKVTQVPSQLSETGACDVLAKALLSAWECYDNPSSVVLFLVLDMERNIFDQRSLEYGLYTLNPKVKVIRRTMKDMTERGCLTDDAKLVIDGFEIAIVYQRSLYVPEHYSSEQDWKTRLLIERSRAIKCPSAAYHLAGTKKVQQILAKPGVLEQFLTDPEAIRQIRNTFAGQYSLDFASISSLLRYLPFVISVKDKEGDKAVARALENPHSYVLKPQREGGGNNLYGDDICLKLTEVQNSIERTAYILMDYIHPYPVKNYLICSGQPAELNNCVNELGIFGAFVGTKDEVVLNCSGGSLLRCKAVGTHEGGVAGGYSCIDSPFLI